jgi:hypothetical protein
MYGDILRDYTLSIIVYRVTYFHSILEEINNERHGKKRNALFGLPIYRPLGILN